MVSIHTLYTTHSHFTRLWLHFSPPNIQLSQGYGNAQRECKRGSFCLRFLVWIWKWAYEFKPIGSNAKVMVMPCQCGYGYAMPVWLWLCLSTSNVMVTLLSCKQWMGKVMVMPCHQQGYGNTSLVQTADALSQGYGNAQREWKQDRLWV